MTSTQLYLRLLCYVRPHWQAFAVSILGMIVAAATEPLLPALLKPFLDGTFVHKDDWVMRWAPVFILGIFFVRGLAGFFRVICHSLGRQPGGDGFARRDVRQVDDAADPLL